MNIYGYVEVFVKVELENEAKPLYNRLRMDFSKEIKKDFFDALEDMMIKYYETRFKKKVFNVTSITEEEYNKNEKGEGPQMVVSFNGDDVSYKDETPTKKKNFCYKVSYSFFEQERIVGPFSSEKEAFLAMKEEAEKEYNVDIYENKKFASLSISNNEGKIELHSKPEECSLPEDTTLTTWQIYKMEE